MPWFTCHRCGRRTRTETKSTRLLMPFAVSDDPSDNIYLTLCDDCIERLVKESYVVSEPICC